MDNHPLDPLIKLYLSEKDITKKSYELYITILKQYACYLKDNNIRYANKADVTNYINFKKNQGYSNNWLYLQVSTVKAFYKYLSLNQKRLNLPEVYAYDIIETVKNFVKKPRSSTPVLTASQAKQLLINTRDNRKYIWHYRDYAIIYLMLTTGLRSVEVRRAKKKDLKAINNQHILYIQGKGKSSTDMFVKVSKGLMEAIDAYLSLRKDKSPFLFISHSRHTDSFSLDRTFFYQMFKRVLKDAGLEDARITPHSLRHTSATLNLLSGGTLAGTSVFLRHENIDNTLIYSHHLDELEDDYEDRLEDYILGNEE
ncbi:MAG: tyrosine-type recombinase/integrase [Alphaproteobacteria bacterium]